MICTKSAGIGCSANDAAKCQDYVIFTGSWDGVCKRWMLRDILGNLNHDIGSQLHMPQQVYRSTTWFEVIASPVSWCFTICQLAIGIIFAKGSPQNKGEATVPVFFGLPRPRLLFWHEYCIVSIAAWFYVSILMFDVHNRIKKKIFDIHDSPKSTDWKNQKMVGDFNFWLNLVHMFLWFFSQVLWLNTLRYLVMAFDCTHLEKINNSERWLTSVINRYHYDGNVMVIDEDRGVQCSVGGNMWMWIAIHGFILNLLYVCLSLPLLVALGDCNLVLSASYLKRCTPFQFYNVLKFEAQRMQWPKYAGSFTRQTKYYYFEAALMAAKVMIPCVIIVTTYMVWLRCICNVFMSLVVAFFAASRETTPVKGEYPKGMIRVFAFILVAVSLGQAVYDWQAIHDELMQLTRPSEIIHMRHGD